MIDSHVHVHSWTFIANFDWVQKVPLSPHRLYERFTVFLDCKWDSLFMEQKINSCSPQLDPCYNMAISTTNHICIQYIKVFWPDDMCFDSWPTAANWEIIKLLKAVCEVIHHLSLCVIHQREQTVSFPGQLSGHILDLGLFTFGNFNKRCQQQSLRKEMLCFSSRNWWG